MYYAGKNYFKSLLHENKSFLFKKVDFHFELDFLSIFIADTIFIADIIFINSKNPYYSHE